MKRVVMDVDCGLGVHGADVDDALALLMAMSSDRLQLEAVTVVAGNAELDWALSSTLALLESMGWGAVPVGRGAPMPLRRKLRTGADCMRKLVEERGRPYTPAPNRLERLPAPRAAGLEPAEDLLVRTALAAPGEMTLIAIGPLSNVARAILKDARFAPSLHEIILMGGACQTPGNMTPFAEFNMATDPEAAQVVFEAGVPITMVPYDVTVRTLMTGADWAGITQGTRWLSPLVVDGVADWIEFLRLGLGQAGCHLHDLLAAAAAIDPALIQTRRAEVTISLEEPLHAGQTVVRFLSDSEEPQLGPATSVVVDYDNQGFMRLVAGLLRAAESSEAARPASTANQ